MLAVIEANRAGYDEAILLTDDGFVADGSGENIFVVKDGTIYTPAVSTSILPGITRDTIIQIAQRPRLHGRREAADPHRPLPRRRGVHVRHGRRGDADPRGRRPARSACGPVTLAIQKAYLDTVRGKSERWAHWLEYATPAGAGAAASLSQATREIPLSRPVARRAGGGARPRGAALRPALARADDRAVRGALRRARRRAVRRGGLERHGRPAPALPHAPGSGRATR